LKIQNILRLLVYLIADRVGIIPSRGNEEIKRLLSRVAGAVGHNIVELAVRLGVQLVEYHRMNIETVFRIGFCGKHLIEAPQRLIDQAFLRQHWLNAGFERRTLLHHAAGHVKYNGSLLPVRGTAIDLAAVFHVAAGKEQGHRSGQHNNSGQEDHAQFGVDEQTQMAKKVQETFSDFHMLAERTKESVRNMEKLVEEMHESNHLVVHAIERIRDISENTAKLTDKSANSLEGQLDAIRNITGRIDNLSLVSTEIEQEMTKFKLGK